MFKMVPAIAYHFRWVLGAKTHLELRRTKNPNHPFYFIYAA